MPERQSDDQQCTPIPQACKLPHLGPLRAKRGLARKAAGLSDPKNVGSCAGRGSGQSRCVGRPPRTSSNQRGSPWQSEWRLKTGNKCICSSSLVRRRVGILFSYSGQSSQTTITMLARSCPIRNGPPLHRVSAGRRHQCSARPPCLYRQPKVTLSVASERYAATNASLSTNPRCLATTLLLPRDPHLRLDPRIRALDPFDQREARLPVE